jgi:AGZA family xanthine/uracil permease-like MFS transporter
VLVLTRTREAIMNAIPLSLKQAISVGIGFGFITYLLLLIMQRRWRDINPLLVIVSLLFALSFALEQGTDRPVRRAGACRNLRS